MDRGRLRLRAQFQHRGVSNERWDFGSEICIGQDGGPPNGPTFSTFSLYSGFFNKGSDLDVLLRKLKESCPCK